VGYRVPLFLRGQDDIANLELVDIDVYWTIVGQLIVGTRQLSVGATISGVALDL
jgi:hypothetical protein